MSTEGPTSDCSQGSAICPAQSNGTFHIFHCIASSPSESPQGGCSKTPGSLRAFATRLLWTKPPKIMARKNLDFKSGGIFSMKRNDI